MLTYIYVCINLLFEKNFEKSNKKNVLIQQQQTNINLICMKYIKNDTINNYVGQCAHKLQIYKKTCILAKI